MLVVVLNCTTTYLELRSIHTTLHQELSIPGLHEVFDYCHIHTEEGNKQVQPMDIFWVTHCCPA